MKYKNQLVLTGRINDVGDPVFENVPDSYRAGIEFTYGLKPVKSLTLDGNIAFSVNRINDFTEYVDNWDEWPEQIVIGHGSTDISFSPAVIFNNNIDFEPVSNLHFILISKYVSKQYIDNTSDDSRALDPYFVNDFLIRYSLSPKLLEQLSISFKINNLFNEEYESNAWIYRYYSAGEYGYYDGYFPQAGIHFVAGVSVGF
jgi:iron complex outermembrane receptor protein